MVLRICVVVAGVGFLTGGLLAGGCLMAPPPPDTSDPSIDGVEDLTPDQGFQLRTPVFDVPAGTEVQDCYFFAVPDINHGDDVFINRIRIGERDGTHHMTVFRVNSIINLSGAPGDVVHGGECRISTNWADWPLVANSQDVGVDWHLPEGVAQRFHPGELLMLQAHYVNASTQKTPNGGEAKVNFYKSPDPDPIEMGTLFATQQSIRICQSHPNPSFDGTCSFPPGADIHIAAANGHGHSRLASMRMYTWDGLSLEHPGDDDMFYESLQWDDPPMATGLDAVSPSGGGVWWTCAYQWREPSAGCDAVNDCDPEGANDCCYTFGGTVETAEHCNAFVYYWPKIDTDVFCN